MNSSLPVEASGLRGVASGTARLMFYTLLAIVLMALDFRGGYVDRIQSLAGQMTEPLILLIDWPYSSFQSIANMVNQRVELDQRLDQLQRELLETRAGLAIVDDLVQENARLRALLDTQQRIRRPMLVAELAAIDLDPFAHRIVVKRGSRDGVEIGMPVMDAEGVIGQVEYVHRNTARVILLSDPDHALPVQVLPSGERTIAYGTGSLDRLRLSDMPMNTVVQPDQLVVTSGLGGQFPAGLAVGRILEVTRIPGQSFANVDIQPLAAMTRNRQVLILTQPEHSPIPEVIEPVAASLDDDRQADRIRMDDVLEAESVTGPDMEDQP